MTVAMHQDARGGRSRCLARSPLSTVPPHIPVAGIARRRYNQPMTTAAKKLLEDALELPERERREMAEALLDSVEEPSGEVEAAWRTEVLRRVEEIQSGAVTPEPWSEVRKHIRGAGPR